MTCWNVKFFLLVFSMNYAILSKKKIYISRCKFFYILQQQTQSMMHQLLFLKTRRIAKVSFFWDHSHYMCKCSCGFPPRKEASNWLSTKIACSFFGRKPLELISWLESVKKLTLVLFLTLPHEIILLHFLHSQFSYFWNFGLIFSYLIQNSGHINRHEEHWFMEWENQVSDFFFIAGPIYKLCDHSFQTDINSR